MQDGSFSTMMDDDYDIEVIFPAGSYDIYLMTFSDGGLCLSAVYTVTVPVP